MAVDLTKLYVRNVELNNETELSFYQSEIGDVGCVVWDAALVLCKYLETEDFEAGEKLKGKKVLELGAGTGAVGLVAAALGAHSVITDLPQFVPLMQHNISANEKVLNGMCIATALTWGNTQDVQSVTQGHCPNGIDYILIADCVYYDESVKPLVDTIDLLSGPQTKVLCCYEDRDLGDKTVLQNKFFKMASSRFDLFEIPPSSQDPHFSSSDIHIVSLAPKSAVPVENDESHPLAHEPHQDAEKL